MFKQNVLPIHLRYLSPRLYIQVMQSDAMNFIYRYVHRDLQFHEILWTNEALFTNCGMFNKYNKHIGAQVNPREFEQGRSQIKFGFNVCCGVIG